jgi:hypothetical protein
MNEIKGGQDLQILAITIEALTPVQRREWFVKIKMSEKQKNFTDIATRHRLGHGYLASAVAGKYNWSRKVVRALEADLEVDLAPFLTPSEAAKIAIADRTDHRVHKPATTPPPASQDIEL